MLLIFKQISFYYIELTLTLICFLLTICKVHKSQSMINITDIILKLNIVITGKLRQIDTTKQ